MGKQANVVGGDIFIVDDEPAVLTAFSAALRLEGYRVIGFADGGSFLEAAKASTPTCVILDV